MGQQSTTGYKKQRYIRSHKHELRRVEPDALWNKDVYPFLNLNKAQHHGAIEVVEQYRHSTGKQAIYKLTDYAKEKLSEMHYDETQMEMPCSSLKVPHSGFTSVGEWDGQTMLECNDCGAYHTKQRVWEYNDKQ